MKTSELFGVEVADLSMTETILHISQSIRSGGRIHQVAVNAFIFVLMRNSPELKESIVNANLINADGQSVVWASRLLGHPLRERVTGIDLMESLIQMAFRENCKVYLLGAEQKIVEKVVSIYSDQYGPSIIAGFRNGYFLEEEEDKIISDIHNSGAHMLFVAMGSPRKELFLYKYRDKLNLPYIMGVGGTFDVIAGKVNRAPKWMQSIGLEWFFRIIQEPRRMWKRYLITNSLFIWYIILEWARGKSH